MIKNDSLPVNLERTQVEGQNNMDISKSCTNCDSSNVGVFTHYETKNNGIRELLRCNDCGHVYAETANTFMLKTPQNFKRIKLMLFCLYLATICSF